MGWRFHDPYIFWPLNLEGDFKSFPVPIRLTPPPSSGYCSCSVPNNSSNPAPLPWRETWRQGKSRNRELLMMQSVVLNPSPCCRSQEPPEASSSTYPSSPPSGFFPFRPLSFKVSLAPLIPKRISSNLFNLILFRVLFYKSQDSGFRGIRICRLGTSSRSNFRRVSRSRTWHGEPLTSFHVLSVDCWTLFVS